MKKMLLLCFLITAQSAYLTAQIPDGSIAPNFVAKDINGTEHNLYDILASGRDVILDFSTTWCGPCWSYKQGHTIRDFYLSAGPDGENKAMAFFIESDATTTMEDLKGLTPETQGDWVTGTEYPIIDNAGISAAYQIGSYPTILMVCKDRKVKNVGRANALSLSSQVDACPSNDTAPEPHFFADKHDGCESIEVQFTDNSWPYPTSWLWEFGDGTTSDERHPMHSFDSPGNYSVKLTTTNSFGTNEIMQSDFIAVGTGTSKSEQNVGPASSSVGDGRIFEGGHHALIFDAEAPFVLASVKVYSDKEAERIVTLLNSAGEPVNSKRINIPKGEHRIDLDFFVDKGTDYRLGLYSEAYMFRNNGGINYPYKIDDLVSITGSTAGQPGYYYYFYDWAVREAGCQSSTNIDEVTVSDLKIFPNPVSEQLTIERDFPERQAFIITNALGQVISQGNFERHFSRTNIDVANYAKGVYYLKSGSRVYKFIKE